MNTVDAAVRFNPAAPFEMPMVTSSVRTSGSSANSDSARARTSSEPGKLARAFLVFFVLFRQNSLRQEPKREVGDNGERM